MLGLYFHIPFCLKKCSYCDFLSIDKKDRIDAYMRALLKETELTGAMYNKPVDSVFFGGGTPSLPDAGYIVAVMDELRRSYTLYSDAEVTLEANPCSLTKEKLAAYREAGVNRLSIGLQAAQNRHLLTLGRQHTVELFDEAYDLAREAGFTNINIDIIYALPEQTLEDWEATLVHVIEKRPEHVSAYALGLEEGTLLYEMVENRELEPAGEDMDLAMYHMAQDLLADRDYENYEISNFAQRKRECRHNLKYWNIKDYLGLGAAAHSCIDRLRFANTLDIDEYIANLGTGKLHYSSYEMCSDDERKIEYIMLKLRLKNGFSFFDYKSRFGEDFLERFRKEVLHVYELGLITLDDRGIAPTRRGFDLQNQLVAEMIRNL